MFTLQKSYLDGDLWYALYENGILAGAWYHSDLPKQYLFLLEESNADLSV